MTKDILNPFITSGYAGAHLFCDREEETRNLLDLVASGNSVTITAIRRIGKTGLVRHVLDMLPENSMGIYIDILPTEDMGDFIDLLMTALMNAASEKASRRKKILDFIRSLRPLITFDPLTGNPVVSIDSRKGEAGMHIEQVFRFLEKMPGRVIIAIDEFQQILKYPERNTDAWLRGQMQSLNNISFVFSGSRQHLLSGLFTDPSRPFYRSTGMVNLGRIDNDVYAKFIENLFSNAGRQISMEVIEEILRWTDLHTYYVQSLCNRVFASGHKKVTTELWKLEAHKILEEQKLVFFRYRDLLSGQQWQLLKAIATEGKVFAPTASDFIMKHSLVSSASVLRALEALLNKEMIYTEYDDAGKMYYCVYDVWFMQWMQMA